MFNDAKLNNKLLRDSNALLKEEITRLKRNVSIQIEQFEIRNITRDNDRLKELSLKNLELSREVALLKLEIKELKEPKQGCISPNSTCNKDYEREYHKLRHEYNILRENSEKLMQAIVNIALKI